MYPAKTYELRIGFNPQLAGIEQTKELVKTWLQSHQVDTFVEGVVEGLDIDHDYENPDRDIYAETGGDRAPISIYKFSGEALTFLRQRLQEAFGKNLECSIVVHPTKEWVEGWKESFKPVVTNRFFIYPPWHSDPLPQDKIAIEIEPAMAFGTGQHATTVLCLECLEKINDELISAHAFKSLADIGTGTGILAIAMAKLGFKPVLATDVDADALSAAKANAEINKVKIHVQDASHPVDADKKFRVVVANILAVVLRRILPHLVALVEEDGNLILSGLLTEDAGEFTRLLTAKGFTLEEQTTSADWCCLRFRNALPN